MSVVSVLCVYLPSSDHSFEEFVNELECAVSALPEPCYFDGRS